MKKTHILRYVLMVSVLAVIALPLFTAFFIYPSFNKILIDRVEKDAARMSTHLVSMLLTESTRLTKDFVSAELITEIVKIKEDFEIEKIKLFSESGEIVYSTDKTEIGTINEKDYFHDIVAKGGRYTKIVKKDTESLEGRIVTADVVETYVPVMVDGRFAGAFEIYYDITETQRLLDKQFTKTIIIVFVVSLVLLVAILFSVYKANSSIAERDLLSEELKQHRDKLEDIVKERGAKLISANEDLNKEIDRRKMVEADLVRSSREMEQEIERRKVVEAEYHRGVEELKRFYNITFNREDRIKALKNEIEKLKKGSSEDK